MSCSTCQPVASRGFQVRGMAATALAVVIRPRGFPIPADLPVPQKHSRIAERCVECVVCVEYVCLLIVFVVCYDSL